MKITPKYGDRIITLPATALLEHLPDATRAELSVLIYTLANQSCTMEEVCEGCSLDKNDVTSALNKLKELGLLTFTGAKSKKATAEKKAKTEETQPAKEQKRVVIISSDLPTYSNTQINDLLSRNKETKELVDACQQTLGRILKIHEIEVLLKLYDYLNLGCDYILLLCAHCKSIGKATMRYIEKTAVALYDSGITEYTQLEAHFEYHNIANSMEGKIRKLYGFGERALTATEKKYVLNWATWGFSTELIEKAYEITVNSAVRPTMNYTNGILENWYNSGLKTEAEIDRAMEEHKKQKRTYETKKSKDTKKDTGSFDTDDFFNLALNRSYGKKADNK